MLNQFIKIMKAKWFFFKPNKKKLLVYDLPDIFKRFIAKKNYETLDVRFQSINFYILLVTLLKTGFKNIKDQYKKNYLICVSPKIVITSIDNNLSFFKLKEIYKKAKYICIQISLRDKNFLKSCEQYYKKKKQARLKSDYFFVYGENDKINLEKYIDSKYIISGSIINNFFFPAKKKTKKIDKIIFISQATREFTFSREFKIVKKLVKVSEYLRLPLFYLLKMDKKHFITKKIKYSLKNYYFSKKVKYIEDNKYESFNSNALIFTLFSTMGFEAISKKNKVIFLPIKSFPSKDYLKKYPNNGPFWTTNHTITNIKKISKKILFLSYKKWSRLVDKNIKGIINYEPNNIFLVNLLKKNNIQIKRKIV